MKLGGGGGGGGGPSFWYRVALPASSRGLALSLHGKELWRPRQRYTAAALSVREVKNTNLIAASVERDDAICANHRQHESLELEFVRYD